MPNFTAHQFANGVSKITLSQFDIAKAVEFWLNEKILKVPCTVVEFQESSVNYSSTFTVGLKEVEEVDESS